MYFIWCAFPDSTALSNKLATYFSECQQRVQDLLNRNINSKITIGADIWSKKNLSASFLGISACLYDELTARPIHLFLQLTQVQHPHTGDMIAETIRSALRKWNIDNDRVLLIITDNGANMVKARKLLGLLAQKDKEQAVNEEADSDQNEAEGSSSDNEVDNVATALYGAEGNVNDRLDSESDSEIDETEENVEDETEEFELNDVIFAEMQSMSCLAHTIQLVVKDGLKDAGVQKFLSKIRSLVRKVRSSSVGTERLIQKSYKVLIIDCATRWSSTLYMLRRFHELKEHVSELFAENKWDCLLASEWGRLEKLKNMLQPFADYTNLLQTDTQALSNIIPAILELQLHLSDTPNDATATRLLASLQSRCNYLLDPTDEKFCVFPAVATLLDPQVNRYLSCRPDLQATAEKYVITVVSRHIRAI